MTRTLLAAVALLGAGFCAVALVLTAPWHSASRRLPLAHTLGDVPSRGVYCTPRGCCHLVDASDVAIDRRDGEQETLDDEDELACASMSWRPQPAAPPVP